MAEILTDSHCHLDDDGFDEDREAVIGRAASAGVGRIVTIGSLSGTSGAEKSLAIAGAHRTKIRAVVGIHPHDARLADAGVLARIEEMARDDLVVGIGETGLDYHYDNSPRGTQRDVFRSFIRMALELGKPLVIHCREAMQDVIRILDEEDGWSAGGVFHCFSGTQADAEIVVDRGWYVSFAGVITFPRADGLRRIAAAVQADRILVETDAPYLAPVPRRGRRNEPANVSLVALALARARSIDPAEAARLATANAARLFRWPSDPE